MLRLARKDRQRDSVKVTSPLEETEASSISLEMGIPRRYEITVLFQCCTKETNRTAILKHQQMPRLYSPGGVGSGAVAEVFRTGTHKL